MAEPGEAERKAELIAALQRSRADFTHGFQALRRDLDLPSHFMHAFRRHKALYIAGATGLGWVMGRLPFRRKKIYIDRGSNKKIKEAGEAGLLLVGLKFLFSIFRPALAAFAAKKIAAFAESRERDGFSKRL